jgi:hypothetical protein
MSSKNEVVKFYVLRLVDWLPNAVRNIQNELWWRERRGSYKSSSNPPNYYIIKPYLQQRNVSGFNPTVEKQHLAL